MTSLTSSLDRHFAAIFGLKRVAPYMIKDAQITQIMILFPSGKRKTMGKPHPVELRERVIAFIEEGHISRYRLATHTSMASSFTLEQVSSNCKN